MNQNKLSNQDIITLSEIISVMQPCAVISTKKGIDLITEWEEKTKDKDWEVKKVEVRPQNNLLPSDDKIYIIPQRGYIDHVDIHILDSDSDSRDIRLRQFTSWEYKQNKDGSYDLMLHNGVY